MVTGTVVQEPVRAAIWYSLNNYNFEDAVFLAERLHAEVGTLDSVFLLATCYFRSSRVQQAKHLLGQHRESNNAKCDLLYAQCCLQLHDFKSGLLALHGLLCLGESSERDIALHFGEDAGVAFWLLGEFNRLLHQSKEAIRHFQSALKYNPFLWTAYQALCELGESVSPEQCFTMSEFPTFLKHPAPHGCSSCHMPLSSYPSSSPSSHETKPSLLYNGLDTNSKRPSAFTPVDSSKTGYITPDLFGNPTLGKAVASSTPAPRTLQFVTSDFRGTNFKMGGSLYEPAGGGAAVSLKDGAPAGRIQFGSVKGVLDFGSGRRTDIGDGRRVVSGNTPVTPSFGTLPLTTPGGSVHSLHPPLPPQHALSFSTITPSPAPLPTAYTKLLQSAPKSAGKRVMFRDTGCVSPMDFLPPPPSGTGTTDRPGLVLDRSTLDSKVETPGGVEEGVLGSTPPTPTHGNINSITSTADTSELANQIAPLLSRDLRSPPPLGASPSPMPPPRAPVKSAAPLRRSARLSGIGRMPSTSASAKRLSDLAIHSTRAKSRLKSPTSTRRTIETTGKKVGKVTFTTPLASRKTSQAHSHSATPSPLSNHNSKASNVRHDSTPKENEVLVEGAGGKVSASSSMELLTQQTVEQALMASISSLLHLLQQVGFAYQALCHYDLVRAIKLFRSLPPNQCHTPWVAGQIARAYFVGEKFRESAKLFEEVHRMDPHRQDGMELYASSLWHLKHEVDLSVLAESLHSSAPLRPEGLCALASVMNLAKDHESAMKFLLRAVKICPSFTYAHTLLGHEYWVTKHYDKALSSFQSALTLDPRHYNAWYGMAHVYYAQEKYKFAETYASRALHINRCSSIACTQLALAQFHQNELDLALASLERAMTINSSNPIPRFHRARVLEALGRLEEALHQLEELTTSWPKEPNLYITKGKILKKLNRPHEAVLQFSWALDFSRSGTSSHIREEVDQAYNPQDTLNGEEDESYFVPHYDSDEEGEANEDSMQS